MLQYKILRLFSSNVFKISPMFDYILSNLQCYSTVRHYMILSIILLTHPIIAQQQTNKHIVASVLNLDTCLSTFFTNDTQTDDNIHNLYGFFSARSFNVLKAESMFRSVNIMRKYISLDFFTK